MNTLAIDCSSSVMSVSLEKDNSLFESSIQDGFKNSENLMPLIDSILKTAHLIPSELDLIAVASGPGSFTGLRIAMSTGKGIALGAGADLVSVSTLDAYGMRYDFFEGMIIPVIDARKKRVYCSLFENGIKIKENLDISAENLMKLTLEYKKILFTGPDCDLFTIYAEKDNRIYIDRAFTTTSSTDVLRIGKENYIKNGSDPSGVGPLYIRKSEAEISLFGE